MIERAVKLLPIAGVFMLLGLVWHYVWMSGDGWWYLALGREIAGCRCLPQFNDLAFTGYWTQVLHQQWLPYIVLYGSYKVGGYAALYALTAAMIAGAVAMALMASRERGDSQAAFIVLAFLGAATLWDNFSVRSEPFAVLMFGIEVWLISRIREGKKAPLWLLVPLFMVWANSHSSLPLGIVYPLVIGAGWRLDTRRGDAERGFGKVGIWLVIAMAATLINPYGPAIYKDIFSRLLSPSTDVIEIFKSPDFHELYVLLQGAWMLLLWVGIMISPKRPTATDLAVAVVFSLMFLNAQRYFVFLFISTLPVAASHWGAFMRGRFDKPAWKAALVAVCIAVGTTFMVIPRHFRGVTDELARAANHMKGAGVKGHVFDYYTWSGFLLWAHPEMKIFIDGRNNIYERSGVFDDYRAAVRGGRYWKDTMDIYGINAVIWPRYETPLFKALSTDPDWKLLCAFGQATVFLRATPENMSIIEKYRVIYP